MRVLVTGAFGQIGTELTEHLRAMHGSDQVMAADIRPPRAGSPAAGQPWVHLDVTDARALESLLTEHRFETIYHLAAILSGKGEENPQAAYHVNMTGTMNVLEAARKLGVGRLFLPSSIAVFGHDSPRDMTPNETVLRPGSMYGITKVAGELLLEYYVQRYGLDVRSLRFPGIISYKTEPGGGTTDYAVDIFVHAVQGRRYRCFLTEGTRLPFMYMKDVIRAVDALMDAPAELLTRRCYNITGFSADPGDFIREIRRVYGDFAVSFKPDFRQDIADSWPRSVDDSPARQDWGWHPEYDLSRVSQDMLKHVSQILQQAPGLGCLPGA